MTSSRIIIIVIHNLSHVTYVDHHLLVPKTDLLPPSEKLFFCRFSATTRSTVGASHSSQSLTSPPGSDSSSVPLSNFSPLSGLLTLPLKANLSHSHCSHFHSQPTFLLLLSVIVIPVTRKRLGPEATGCVKCAHCHHLPSPAPPPPPASTSSPADQEAEVSV